MLISLLEMPVSRCMYLLHHLVDLDEIDLLERLSSHPSCWQPFLASHATHVMVSVLYFTCCSVLATTWSRLHAWKLHLEDAASQ